jgi:hypothetical protein
LPLETAFGQMLRDEPWSTSNGRVDD